MRQLMRVSTEFACTGRWTHGRVLMPLVFAVSSRSGDFELGGALHSSAGVVTWIMPVLAPAGTLILIFVAVSLVVAATARGMPARLLGN
jgi:hypothetical protein